MTSKNEKLILNVIKYFPSFFILLFAIITSITIYNEHQENVINEKNQIKNQYLKESKKEIKILVETTDKLIMDIRKDSILNLKKELKDQVTNAYRIANTIFNKYKNKKTKEEITELIKTALKNIRFNKERGYLFIYEMNATTIMNDKFPHLEGNNLWGYKDQKGTLIFQEMNYILKTKSETYYDWYWQKTNEDKKHYKKIGFFKKFEAYDWYIGTGEYLDDYNQTLKHNVLSYIRKIRYKDKNYIFVTDNKGNILVNKYLNLIGRNVKDFEGEHLAKGFRNPKKLKEGVFFEYTLNEEEKKVSYVKLLEYWNWVIGTGFNLNDAKHIIKEREALLEKKYDTYLTNFILINASIIFVLLILSTLLSKYIEKIFYRYKYNLEKNHKILLKAQQTAHIGDWRLDTKTMKAHWSDEILRIFGIENISKDLGPEFLKTIMHPDDWHCFEESITKTITKDTEHYCIYRVIRPSDKKEVWIDCRGKRSASGRHVYGTVQDITKRKLLEKEKQHQEALLYQQSKMAAMGEMIGNIAHQWRQPLSVISSSATGAKVQNELDLLTKRDINSYLDTINNTAQHLSRTIEDFRTFFNPKEDNFTTFNIKNTIEKTLNLVSAQFTSKDIIIVKNIEEIKVSSLENELIQALVNILNNAKDVLVEKNEEKDRFIFIDVYKKEEKLFIKIKDNAEGIPKDIIDRIYEPYFTTKHKSQGTGIGLYMTRDIITNLLSGSIIVENKEFTYKNINYIGAEFTIILDIK